LRKLWRADAGRRDAALARSPSGYGGRAAGLVGETPTAQIVAAPRAASAKPR